MDQRIKVWYDAEADYLEVTFKEEPGFFRETANDSVMARVNKQGEVIGFSILKVSELRDRPLELSITGS